MCNARNDAFIQWLEEEYGFEGIGRWWRVLELIGEAMEKNRALPTATYTASFWQKQLNMKPAKLISYFKAIELQGKWEIQVQDNLITITCPNIMKMRDEYSRKSGHKPDNVAPEIRDKSKDTDTEKKVSKKPEPAQAPLFQETKNLITPEQQASDFKTVIWQVGLKLIGGEKKRSLMGRWLRDFGEAHVVNALIICHKNKPLDPVEYIEKLLKTGGEGRVLGEKPKSDPHRDISNYKVIRDD